MGVRFFYQINNNNYIMTHFFFLTRRNAAEEPGRDDMAFTTFEAEINSGFETQKYYFWVNPEITIWCHRVLHLYIYIFSLGGVGGVHPQLQHRAIWSKMHRGINSI